MKYQITITTPFKVTKSAVLSCESHEEFERIVATLETNVSSGRGSSFAFRTNDGRAVFPVEVLRTAVIEFNTNQVILSHL